MQWELLFFLRSLSLGVLFYVIYDAIKCIRTVWKHHGFLIGMEDMIFWIGSGIYIFIYLYRRNYGILRIYEIIAMLSGAVLYGCFLSTYFEKALTWVLRWLRKLFAIPLGIMKKFIKWLKKLALRVKITLRKYRKHKEEGGGKHNGPTKSSKVKPIQHQKEKPKRRGTGRRGSKGDTESRGKTGENRNERLS